MKSAKDKIRTSVKEYSRLFPQEYKSFLSSVRIKEDNRINDFAEFKGSDQIVRHLFDMPENLYFTLQQLLQDHELDWFFGRGDYNNNRAGIRWFIKEFPQFKITKDF